MQSGLQLYFLCKFKVILRCKEGVYGKIQMQYMRLCV